MIRTDDGRKTAAYERITHRGGGLAYPCSPAPIPSADDTDLNDDAGCRCISCGYEQHDQPIDRCPECGLGFASLLRDQTPWASGGGTLPTFLVTAGLVLAWDRRTRTQTAYMPCTPLSKRFALLCIALAVLPLALATPMALGLSSLSSAGLVSILLGIVAFWCLAAGTLQVLHLFVQGTWRRRLPFVPASVDYACAWWPPIACVSFLVGTGGALSGAGSTFWFATVIPGAAIWLTWLWGSASESGHVRYPFGRILVVTLASCALTGQALLLIWRYSPAIVAARAAAAPAGAPGTGGPAGIVAPPRTYTLAISPRGAIEAPVMEALSALGTADQDLFMLETDKATLVGINDAVARVDSRVQYQDTLIVYLNTIPGRGGGTLVTAAGEVTPEKLCSLLKFRTRDVLLILDGPTALELTDALKAAKDLNLLVLAKSPAANPGETIGLADFWEALSTPEADLDKDGDVTAREAYWWAYPDAKPEGNMLTAARFNPSLLAVPQNRSGKPDDVPLPSFFRVGNVDPDAFAANVSQAPMPLQGAAVQSALASTRPAAPQSRVRAGRPGTIRPPMGQPAPPRFTVPAPIRLPGDTQTPWMEPQTPSWSSDPMRTRQWPVAPLPPGMQPDPIPLPGQRPR